MEPTSFHNQEVVLGSLVVDGQLPDIEARNCTLLWGDYPPARIGLICMEDVTLKGSFSVWPSVRVERRWLFFLRYTAEMWMGRNDQVVFKDCTFAENTSEAVDVL